MRATLVVSSVLLVFLLARPADATQVLAMSVEEATDASDLVVRGTIEAAHPARPPGARGRIVTVVTVRVVSTLKGSLNTPRLVVTVPGGQDGRFAQVIAGTPQLTPGDEVVLFLERVTGSGDPLVITGLSLRC